MLKRWRLKVYGGDGHRPLIQDEEQQLDGIDSVAAENALNRQQEQSLQPSAQGTKLVELLGLEDHDSPSDLALIANYVEQKLPDVQAWPKDLQRHLQAVQDIVLKDLLSLQKRIRPEELMKSLLKCYHRRVCGHLQALLLLADSTEDSFGLMHWARRRYLSEELLCHPHLKSLEPLEQVDLLLLSEWMVQAKSKVLESVQWEVQDNLEKILKNLQGESWRGHRVSNNEEDFIALSFDTIQCVEASPKQAQHISEDLSKCVREVCCKELLVFVQNYVAQQTALLRMQTKTNQPEMTQFLKTLYTCQELRQYVQTRDFKPSVSMDCIVKLLEDMRDLTLGLLKTNITRMMEVKLMQYFKSNSQRFSLTNALTEPFMNTSHCGSVLKVVIDEAYRIITHLYLRHLIKHPVRQLERKWSSDVAHTVAQDAQMLEDAMEQLAPGLQQWNMVLLRVAELLQCRDTEAMKVVVASMSKECMDKKEDLNLLPSILKWKGLSKREAWMLLDFCPHSEPPPPKLWYRQQRNVSKSQ